MKPCCEKCFDSFGGGASMLPLIRRCSNTDCECHAPTQPDSKGWRDELAFNWEKITRDEATLKAFIGEVAKEAKLSVVKKIQEELPPKRTEVWGEGQNQAILYACDTGSNQCRNTVLDLLTVMRKEI